LGDILPTGGSATATKATVTDASTGTTTYYSVHLMGIATNAIKRIAAAGGFNVDFGASLGDLAGIHASGDIIPIANLLAQATFGIDLSPSQNLDVGPQIADPGPRVEVSTVQQGGKSISISTLRPGVMNTVGEIQVVSVRSHSGSGEKFRLTLGTSGQSDPIDVGADKDAFQTKLQVISGLSGNINVSKATNPAADVYTITFDKSLGDVTQLSADGSQLQPRNEQQQLTPQNVTGGSFTFPYSDARSFLRTGQVLENTGVTAYDGAVALLRTPQLQTAGATIATVEARHASFLNFVNGDNPFPSATDTPKSPGEIIAAIQPFVRTAPFGYLRLRGPEYPEAELIGWAEKIRGAGFSEDVLVYFKHEEAGKGPEFARRLLDALGA